MLKACHLPKRSQDSPVPGPQPSKTWPGLDGRGDRPAVQRGAKECLLDEAARKPEDPAIVRWTLPSACTCTAHKAPSRVDLEDARPVPDGLPRKTLGSPAPMGLAAYERSWHQVLRRARRRPPSLQGEAAASGEKLLQPLMAARQGGWILIHQSKLVRPKMWAQTRWCC